jgi:hypothetical protein
MRGIIVTDDLAKLLLGIVMLLIIQFRIYDFEMRTYKFGEYEMLGASIADDLSIKNVNFYVLSIFGMSII